jgi:putative membrane protein
MAIIAGVFVALAAVLHVFIFILESVWWTRPSTWKRFGLASQADADTTRPMAYNQGFYNLFLAAGAALGLLLWVTNQPEAGAALVLFSTGSMALAALVLTTTGHRYIRPALIQGTLPLIGFVLFLLA